MRESRRRSVDSSTTGQHKRYHQLEIAHLSDKPTGNPYSPGFPRHGQHHAPGSCASRCASICHRARYLLVPEARITSNQKQAAHGTHWPHEQRLRILVEKADCLFIFAATACLFIDVASTVSPEKRLSDLVLQRTI